MRQKILLIALVFTTFLKVAANNHIAYQVSPVVKDSVCMLKVRMDFILDQSGVTLLEYADNPWGEEGMQQCIFSMKTPDIESTISKDSINNVIRIEHEPLDKKIRFEYLILQDFEGTIHTSNYFRPVINLQYFHFIAQSFFMLPKHFIKDNDTKINVEIVWQDFPKDYVIHNSFGSQERKQSISNITKIKFQESVFVGGDFRLYEKEIEGNRLILATRGEWLGFRDAEVVDLLYTTVKSQRNFWNDHSQKYFTVTMMPFPMENARSYSGTGLTNSFATSVSNNEHTSINQLLYLFNHELMHNWIRVNSGIENEEQQYWLSEGFTDYYTYKNISKNRILNSDASYFFDNINKTIRELFTSPVAERPNSDLNTEIFWTNRYYEKLPYLRGALIAFILDLKIQNESNGTYSLDDVVKELFLKVDRDSLIFNEKAFIEVANTYVNNPIDEFIHDHIIQGKLPDLEYFFSKYKLQFESFSDAFDLGFTPNDQYNKILDIDTTSNAYKAGLRKTDQLGRWGFTHGVIDKEIRISVYRKGTKETIIYLPVKKMKIPNLLDNTYNRKQIRL